MEMYTDLINALTKLDADKSAEEVSRLLDAGVDPFEIIENGLMQAMDTVGNRFDEGTFFLPELLLAAKAVEACSALIRPLLFADGQHVRGTVVVGTVAGDIHDLGKNLIISTLESAGFRVIDLGVDVPMEDFVETVRREEAKILAMSALLTVTMVRMEEVIQAVRSDPELKDVKIMVGGAPVDQKYADAIGADAFGENALEAMQKARMLVSRDS
jgi:5-methyltetrahydrofolate--homocysteine methyltransferase